MHHFSLTHAFDQLVRHGKLEMALGLIIIAGSSTLPAFTINNVISELIVLTIIPLLLSRYPVALMPLCVICYLWISGFTDHVLLSGFIIYLAIEYSITVGRRAVAVILTFQWLFLAYGVAHENLPTAADGPAIMLEGLFIFVAVTGGQFRFIAMRERQRRIAAQQKLEKEIKSDLARYLHDSVARSLTMIVMQAEIAQADATDIDARRRLKSINTTSQEAIANLHQLVNHLIDTNPQGSSAMIGFWHTDSISETIKSTATLLDEAGYQVSINDFDLKKRFSRAIETVFSLVFNEATANLVKHSPGGGPVSIIVYEHSHHLSVEVINTRESTTSIGSGKFRGCGVGLASMRRRMSEIGGDADIITTPDSWHVRLLFPLYHDEERRFP